MTEALKLYSQGKKNLTVIYGEVSRSVWDSSSGPPLDPLWHLCLKSSAGGTRRKYCGLNVQKRTESEGREPVD